MSFLKFLKKIVVSEKAKYLFPIYLYLIIEYFLTLDIPFFWDALSKFWRANWIFENNFSSFIVPSTMNSGHPPLWITSLALIWKIFGRSLWVSRLLLLLVTMGVFYQLFILAKSLFAKNVSMLLFFFICLEPTLLAQTTSLNNDMLLLFFTLLGCNAILKNKSLLLAIALAGALLTNLRGVYIFFALGICHWVLYRNHYIKSSKTQLFAYVSGLITFLLFAIYQYHEIGWAIITKQTNFAKHREVATFQSIAKNVLVYIKFYLDFGRVFIIVPLSILLLKYRKQAIRFNGETHKTFLMLIVFVIVFFFGIVPFSNPAGPRYLMIAYILAMILFVNLFYDEKNQINIKKWLIPVVSIGLISGHFWIYPPKIAQAWDSSFAHLNYFSIEKKMLKYIDNHNIPKGQIGTYVRINTTENTALENSANFSYFPYPDINKDKYIIMSNIENTMTDETLDIIFKTWSLKQEYSQLGVFIALYENPNL
ncbi:glycosyltransferase family 39 protein [Aequorivita echinoideorum]|uniref:Glycosyltransferase family 39 protein n=1 Tax=Aequorivita echinoideorum TaxID=1549647 RepID=A0ABS5S5W6_9FLAO|nr:glycosyltransferase family 39 protein [Aequorivita echinoideorum]MBT0608574.1 glycosyltransferase family 39 protein [Aequorivita echinoideorum]